MPHSLLELSSISSVPPLGSTKAYDIEFPCNLDQLASQADKPHQLIGLSQMTIHALHAMLQGRQHYTRLNHKIIYVEARRWRSRCMSFWKTNICFAGGNELPVEVAACIFCWCFVNTPCSKALIFAFLQRLRSEHMLSKASLARWSKYIVLRFCSVLYDR